MIHRILARLGPFLLAPLLACPHLSTAAEPTYPSHAIRMIVPFSAGGGTDVVARNIAKALSDRLKQPIVIDNRVGAGSTIGTDLAAKAPADGYTLLFASAAHSFSPTVYPKLPYAQDDFVPIALVNSTPLILTINPSVPARDLKSFIALVKAHPGKYNYASSGVGTTLHIAAEHFVSAAGLSVVHVPYRGESLAMNDLLADQVSFMVGQASSAVPYLKNGRLIGLGVTTPARLPSLPDMPTLSEAGLSGFSAYGWNAILVPKGTPRAIVDLLNREINAVIGSADIQKTFAELGLAAVEPTTPQAAKAFISAETSKWAPVIRAAGIKGE